MSLGEKQLQCLSPWVCDCLFEGSVRWWEGDKLWYFRGLLKKLCWQLFSSDSGTAMLTCCCSLTGSSFSGSPGFSLSHWFGTLRISWLLLCLLLLLREELLYSLFLCSSLTGVIIDAAKASRAAFYCWSQAAELIISGRIDQSESRKVLSAVAVEFSAKQEVAFIWFTHCEMLSFNNSLCFNPSSFLTVCDVRRFCCTNNTLVQPCAFS